MKKSLSNNEEKNGEKKRERERVIWIFFCNERDRA